ncbi:DUF4913 domain-containing protein [Corynebacterium uropygiale]|uniref:DUF4913 domain-containing protein n=1 Tax=Corynebacterium uropygiale TaxID=1775911 RepID=A0A9X1QQ35_9CORY|nr:DUF4913 domain-containing protein [Corynebacterium uropygiale]MCF4006130.1 DUF4913 domain-containing protein [Corynebacterium uropygiale]
MSGFDPELDDVNEPSMDDLASLYDEDNELNEGSEGAEDTNDGMINDPYFPDVYSFVEDFLLGLYPTTLADQKQVNWNKWWYKHEFAIARLTALWMRYEQLRVEDPQAHLETFLRVHADYHMKWLMTDGEFFSRTKRTNQDACPLPSDARKDFEDQ